MWSDKGTLEDLAVWMPQPHPNTLIRSMALMVTTMAKGTMSRNRVRSRRACPSNASSGWHQALETRGLAVLWVEPESVPFPVSQTMCGLQACLPLLHHHYLSWFSAGRSGKDPSSSGLPFIARYLGTGAHSQPRWEAHNQAMVCINSHGHGPWRKRYALPRHIVQ